MKRTWLIGLLLAAACGSPDDEVLVVDTEPSSGGATCAAACSNISDVCADALFGATVEECTATCDSRGPLSCIAGANNCSELGQCETTSPANNGANNDANNDANGGGACPATPMCDEDTAVYCDTSGTIPITRRDRCRVGCADGACINSWEACTPHFDTDHEGCTTGCGDSGITVNGTTYCTAFCGPSGECPTGTECNTGLNGGTCQPPCQIGSDCPAGFLEATVGYCDGFCGGS